MTTFSFASFQRLPKEWTKLIGYQAREKGDVSGEKAVKNGLFQLREGRRSWTQLSAALTHPWAVSTQIQSDEQIDHFKYMTIGNSIVVTTSWAQSSFCIEQRATAQSKIGIIIVMVSLKLLCFLANNCSVAETFLILKSGRTVWLYSYFSFPFCSSLH
jgi:hypothetical protein